MKLGFGRSCISPQIEEFYLIGYRSPTRFEPALGIHDNLYANGLLFDDGQNELFLLSLDLLEIEEEMAEEVRHLLAEKYSISEKMIFLSATHNHSSLASYHKSWYTQKFNPDYYQFLLNQIDRIFQDCRRTKGEVTAKIGRKVIRGYYSNRNHKGQLADNEVILLEFYHQEGQAIAGLINWAVHSTVIGPSNRYLTSDWAGQVSKKLQAYLGYYPAIFVGAAGDCSNRHERQGTDFAELERVSTAMAKEIAGVQAEKTVNLGEIKMEELVYSIHYKMDQTNLENQQVIAVYQKELENCEDTERRAFVQKEIEKLSQHLDLSEVNLRIPSAGLLIGELGLITFPGELASSFGQYLKENSSCQTLILGYTNGYYGYFFPEEEYGLSFETIGTLIPKGEPEKLVQSLAQLIT
ncbi:TPA: neutral/alkaline non-lysosomal ceramidase N-terminal domain-containing protein [Streptococcus suis]|nr:neutral/alkaline non-lysosomal ceramidase N-terminal domain-containing protein [Streptococcus suis]HEM5295532.1 neutral/alkaline non-lysosomal ceramidase N-terminal domain-containing protein [Streptococcus suis]HEM5317730.1 neutral/alkaline non-lysosomal ceramidase N-terminal domain-containing protein [Streptococcus suis]